MSNKILRLEPRPRRAAPPRENPNLVPCARCGERILLSDTRCPECGVHFRGQAGDFSHPSQPRPSRRWLLFVAGLVLLVFLLSSLTVNGR